MLLIAHRGNVHGRNPERENTEDYILEAMSLGFDVEIDAWYKEGKWFLGHDGPEHPMPSYFMTNPEVCNKIWFHCKDVETLHTISAFPIRHAFFHDSDAVTLTTSGFLWTYPGKELFPNRIQVMPEYVKESFSEIAFGICSDLVGEYKE